MVLARPDVGASTKENDVMTEKSLLSLREIARELNLNYRTMLNYKNQIQHLLPEKTDGQISKYPAE